MASLRVLARLLLLAVRKNRWEHVHSAADKFQPRARKVATKAFARAKAKIPQAALQLALKAGDVARVESIIDGALKEFDRAFRKPFTEVLTKVQGAAGTAAAERLNNSKRALSGVDALLDESNSDADGLDEDAKDLLNDEPDATTVLAGHLRVTAPKIKGFAFDKTNPQALEWVDEHVGELIDEMSRVTRERVKDLVERTVDGEFDTHDLADKITELIGDESRAETIARTETMAASNGGQREAWAQAVNDGLLNGDEEEEWITTPDDKTCPICLPMDGEKKPLGGKFNVDGAQIDGPPAHPRCRCTTGLALKN